MDKTLHHQEQNLKEQYYKDKEIKEIIVQEMTLDKELNTINKYYKRIIHLLLPLGTQVE